MEPGEKKRTHMPLIAAVIAIIACGGVVAIVVAIPACGAAHVRLVNVGSPGPLYECNETTCEAAQTDDPARTNQSQMDLYTLPEGCIELQTCLLRPGGPGVDLTCGAKSYRCEGGACRDLDPAAPADGATTIQIHLPEDCAGRIHEVVVLEATTDAPIVYVECDASGGGLEEM